MVCRSEKVCFPSFALFVGIKFYCSCDKEFLKFEEKKKKIHAIFSGETELFNQKEWAWNDCVVNKQFKQVQTNDNSKTN